MYIQVNWILITLIQVTVQDTKVVQNVEKVYLVYIVEDILVEDLYKINEIKDVHKTVHLLVNNVI